MNEIFEEQWKENEKLARENFEYILHEAKRMWIKSIEQSTKKPNSKVLPTVSATLFIIDTETKLPLFISEPMRMLGTHQDLMQMLKKDFENYLKKTLSSLEYNRRIYKLYVELIDKYKMERTEIYPLLHPDYYSLDAKEKKKFQNNLRTNYTRLTRNKKPEK